MSGPPASPPDAAVGRIGPFAGRLDRSSTPIASSLETVGQGPLARSKSFLEANSRIPQPERVKEHAARLFPHPDP